MTRKDCNWGSTLLRSMSIQFLFRPVLRQLGCPQRLKMGLQRIEKTHAESPNGLLQDSDSVEDTSVLEVAPLSIIRQTLYCETREKGSAAILTPDSFFDWGTSRQRHKKLSRVIISLYFSKSQLRHIFPPNSAALDRDCQRTIPTDERRNHFPTHSHTVISSFSFFYSWFWS